MFVDILWLKYEAIMEYNNRLSCLLFVSFPQCSIALSSQNKHRQL
jgi:hypothetical protein